MKYKILFLSLFCFSKVFADNTDYYQKITKNISIIGTYYMKEYKDTSLLPIGTISKNITDTAIILFSQDKENQYLFTKENLDISPKELLINRKKYLENLQTLTYLQKKQLNIINYVLPTTSQKKLINLLNKQDNFGNYLSYKKYENIINSLPILNKELYNIYLMQILSPNTYLAQIMSLLVDTNDFFTEIEKYIFKPLEVKVLKINTFEKRQLKTMFSHISGTLRVNFFLIIPINIYDLSYTTFDTLNLGMLMSFKNEYIITKEIANLILGLPNKLSNNLIKQKLSINSEKDKVIYNTSIFGFNETITYKKEKTIISDKDITGKANITYIDNALLDLFYNIYVGDIPEYVPKEKKTREEIKDEIEIRNFILNKGVIKVGERDVYSKYAIMIRNIIAKSIFDIWDRDINKINFDFTTNKNNTIQKFKDTIFKNVELLVENEAEKTEMKNGFERYIKEFEIQKNRNFDYADETQGIQCSSNENKKTQDAISLFNNLTQ